MTESAAPSPSKGQTGLKSMTGFSQASAEDAGWTLRVSVRSVNHRFLDLHMRLPDGLEALEPVIRREVRERIRRGHVDVAVHLDSSTPASVQVNREVAAAYLEAAEALRRQFSVKAEPDLAALLRLPGVVAAATASIESNWERLAELARNCLREALESLEQMREAEGRALAAELSGRLKAISSIAGRIETLAEKVRPAYARRLEMRLRELLGDTPLDQVRIVQEAAMAAERTDAAEELARLRSHLEQFESLLAAGEETGKKLDFLLQEMQRETSTLLSKTRGYDPESIEITRLGLEIKSEIERLREQVQNIE